MSSYTFRWHHLINGLLISVSCLFSTLASAENSTMAANRYLDMSLEDILSVEVSSASRKQELLSKTAAAAFVISSDDIRRSGATSIPDALRMVPGINVAQINANEWAITSRGFNGRFANKLLVLIDGRTVYTPLFSGVFWSRQDTLLEDIDRIEVIRGPGATLWGSNAVNGVINIITKHAIDTQGLQIIAASGTKERGAGSIRYGQEIGDTGFARTWLKYNNRSNNIDAISGSNVNDHWDSIRGGFRIDNEINVRNILTLQGDIYQINANQRVSTLWQPAPPYVSSIDDAFDDRGWNLLSRWEHKMNGDDSAALQLYYDDSRRQEAYFGHNQSTLDADFQHNFTITGSHNIIWGANFRHMRDSTLNSFNISLTPDRGSESLYSAFLQDEISLIENRLKLTVGSKFEKRDRSDLQIQPNVRLNWNLSEEHMIWGSISKASRAPSRIEFDSQITRAVFPPGPLVFTVIGNPNFVPEKLTAYELGYRSSPNDNVSMNLTTFYNVYNNLLSYERITALTNQIGNQLQGHSYGAELDMDWQATDWWRLRLAYSYLRLNMKPAYGNTVPNSEVAYENGSPKHQASLRSSINLPYKTEFDLWARYTGRLSYANERAATFTTLPIGAYTELDIRISWHATSSLELSITGKNLLHSRRLEYIQELNIQPTYLSRSVFAKAALNF